MLSLYLTIPLSILLWSIIIFYIIKKTRSWNSKNSSEESKNEKLQRLINTNYLQLNKDRSNLFKKIDNLDNVTHVLQATANSYYQGTLADPKGGWNILLKTRDKLKPFLEKEKSKCYKEIDKIDKEILKIKELIK